MKRLGLLFALLIILPTVGCASWWNDVSARGGLIGTYRGDYVVISQSGGEVMDCWVLRDVFIESEKESDGWRFIDNNGNVTFVGGDTKVMRVDDSTTLSKYHEYHMEFETQSYREKFGGE